MTSRSLPRAQQGLFIAAIFASAFLIFLVQPMVAKRILPWFGGAPAVWTLCLAFYQSTLFLGYAYAYLLIRFAKPSVQLGIHALAVMAALAVLPVLPSEAWKPQGAGEPTSRILTMLTVNVALPFMVLASTGPLVQAWFARRAPAQSPYPLYAVSNLGSLLALLAYPIWIEPLLPLSQAGTLWSFMFVPTAAAVLGCAALGRRPGPSAAGEDHAEESEGYAIRGSSTIALWFLLSGTAVVLLMGVTNKLCLDVASVPFLWILPLATYLVTFILSFASERTYRRVPYLVLFVLGIYATATSTLTSAPNGAGTYWGFLPDAFAGMLDQSIPLQIAAHCTLLFAGCMIMHGELYRVRPSAQRLTAFYLCVSGGGALGGLFVGLVAPVLFDDYTEFPLGVGLVPLLLLATRASDPSSWLHGGTPMLRWAVAVSGTLAVIGFVAIPVFEESSQIRHQERGFFGVVQVRAFDGRWPQRQLQHGTTLHGVQFLDDRNRFVATSYYGRGTALGLLLATRQQAGPMRIGVVGLGVGTIAAYGQSGDLIRFYEIDPAIVGIARDGDHFYYLGDSKAKIEVVVADGRISLAAEQDQQVPQAFDVLVVDAFTSDAIPVHLLTREAFERYRAALAPDGVLAVHVSSRYFNLSPLVARMGLEVGLESLQIQTDDAPRHLTKVARWVLLARDRARLAKLERDFEDRYRKMNIPKTGLHVVRAQLSDLEGIPVWTDDHSDLFSLLHRR